MACSHATGFQYQTSVMFPGHRVPESILSYVPRLQDSGINLSHVPSPQSSRTKAQSGSQGTIFHNLNRCHVPRPQFSRITPRSCSQATGILSQTSVMFPGHRVPPSHLSHIPRTQVSRIKPILCSQATGFHNLTSVMFPGQCFPESNLSHIPRPHGSRIKPQ